MKEIGRRTIAEGSQHLSRNVYRPPIPQDGVTATLGVQTSRDGPPQTGISVLRKQDVALDSKWGFTFAGRKVVMACPV